VIRLTQNDITFRYRVAGVALHEGRVLLQESPDDHVWALPGGHAETGENATATLVREMQEELGASVQVNRLLWVVENLFSHAGIRQHELGLYFLMDLGAEVERLYPGPVIADEDGVPMRVAWHPLSTLETLELYPEFLRRGLQALPESIIHIVT
jgi:ADP-ribose pyrophosphatase YjhB (NUDIX family)